MDRCREVVVRKELQVKEDAVNDMDGGFVIFGIGIDVKGLLYRVIVRFLLKTVQI